MHSAGLSERVFFDWMQTKPSFAAAVNRARSPAKAKLIKTIVDASPTDWRAAAFVLSRGYADEYGATQRIEQVNEGDKHVPLVITYSCGNQTFAELTNFPRHLSMGEGADSPGVALAKQAALTGQPAPAPESIADANEDEETIAPVAAPPPEEPITPPPECLTGRLGGFRRNGRKQ